MLYQSLDFSTKDTQTLKIDIYSYFKSEDKNSIYELMKEISEKNTDFFNKNQSFFITKLMEHDHLDTINYLLDNNIIKFDLKTSKYCSFYLGVSWHEKLFNFVVININQHEQKNDMIANFWNEFLEYQLLENKHFVMNKDNIAYAFEKMPFYENSNDSSSNKKIMISRRNFFNNHLPTLLDTTQNDILHLFSSLCAKHYPNFTKEFEEEFSFSPVAIKLFEIHKIKNDMEKVINNHNNIKIQKMKI